MIEIARCEKLPDQGIRYRFAGFGMDGEFGKDFRRFEPMFEQLAGELHEIPGDGGARHSFIGDIGQHRVQRVAEFVEKRPRVIERQQARAVLGGLHEIAYVHRDRPHVASQLALTAERRAPRAGPLAGSREIIAYEDGDVAVALPHLPRPAIRMIKRDFHRAEFKPEQAFGAMEGRVDHMIELKILLACDFVDVVLGFAPSFRVMPPIPRFKFAPDAVLVHHRAQRSGVRFRPGFGGCPHRGQKFANGGRGFRHLRAQFQFRVAGKSEELREF